MNLINNSKNQLKIFWSLVYNLINCWICLYKLTYADHWELPIEIMVEPWEQKYFYSIFVGLILIIEMFSSVGL